MALAVPPPLATVRRLWRSQSCIDASKGLACSWRNCVRPSISSSLPQSSMAYSALIRSSASRAIALGSAALRSKYFRRACAKQPSFGYPVGKQGLIAGEVIDHEMAPPIAEEVLGVASGSGCPGNRTPRSAGRSPVDYCGKPTDRPVASCPAGVELGKGFHPHAAPCARATTPPGDRPAVAGRRRCAPPIRPASNAIGSRHRVPQSARADTAAGDPRTCR